MAAEKLAQNAALSDVKETESCVGSQTEGQTESRDNGAASASEASSTIEND